jgi:lysophospholipid acyltransferase (LPLAT)-like uncharacterized protein
LSPDGVLFGAALARLGLRVVHGSSSRAGAAGLAALVRVLRAGTTDAAVAVDGPRGPSGVAKPGALVAARLAGAHVVPMGAAVARKLVLGSWDRLELAWPFARVAVVLGPPVELPPTEPHGGPALAALEASIALANEAAEALLRPRTYIGSARDHRDSLV